MSVYIAIEIVRKYLAGTSSPEETETVFRWFASLQSFPDNLAGQAIIQDILFHFLGVMNLKPNMPPETEINSPMIQAASSDAENGCFRYTSGLVPEHPVMTGHLLFA
ncbi:hypothetical protein [Mucilaginibacter sp. R-33]|uniref:hypothetical protein n=1 Tax=Mucilaginibacter sp. R-33 TaxID=3416711 RepID=UPI003CFAF3AD